MAKAVAGIGFGAALAIVAWAWINGGREPLREIAVPVAVPEAAR